MSNPLDLAKPAFRLTHAHELGGASLYHFTSLNLEHLAQVLQGNTIYFSRPQDFNDPFELSPFVDMGLLNDEATRRRWLNFIEDIGKRATGGTQKPHVTKTIESARHDVELARALLGDISESMRSVLRAKYRVYCMSLELHSVLMWSHYAAKHQGLVFEFLSRGKFFAFSDKVDYPTAIEPVDPESCDPIELYIRGLLTKAISWQHEREYRRTGSDVGEPGFVHTVAGYAQFPPGELTAVYVGCSMSEACVRAVVNEVRHMKQPIPVHQMTKVDRTLSLSSKTIFQPSSSA